MLEFGTIIKIKNGKALAKVDILGRTTKFLPFIVIANSYQQKFNPPQIGEQVAVLENRLILGSIFNNTCPEPPIASTNKSVTTYKDGTTISYDTEAKELHINASDKIMIVCKSTEVKANKVVINSDSVDLGAEGGTGVITGESICPFTGLTHQDFSTKVRSIK